MIEGVSYTHLGPIWYHSEPSDIPYSPNQFLGWDFLDVSYSKTALELDTTLCSRARECQQHHLDFIVPPAYEV